MSRIVIRSAWFDTYSTGNKARLSSGLRPEVVFRSTCALLHDLARAMSVPCACVFSPSDFLFLLPIYTEKFLLQGQVYLLHSDFSEVPEFSCSADNVYLYISDYGGEDHTVIFFSSNVLPAIVFSSPSHPSLFKIPLQFCHLLMRSPTKFSSHYCHAPLKLCFIEERLDLADRSD